MVKVSIIIPIYNAEAYLAGAIEHVLNQTFSNWELILIDDGSIDGSSCICDFYGNKEDRIKVIHKSNSGVSDTRNQGLSLVSGKYLIFLDADDYWTDDTFLENFVGIAEDNNLDIIRGEYKAVDKNGSDLFFKGIDMKKKMSENTIINSSSFLDNVIQREFFLPLCLIKYDIIKDIRFNTRRVFLEDVEFFLKILLKPLKCYYTSVCFYAYRKHDLSASNKYNSKRLSDAFDISRLYLSLSKTNDIDALLAKSFKQRSWDYYWMTLRTIAVEEPLFTNRRDLCVELGLNALRRDVSNVIPEVRSPHIWIHFLPPLWTINYFRLRYLLRMFYKSFKSYGV